MRVFSWVIIIVLSTLSIGLSCGLYILYEKCVHDHVLLEKVQEDMMLCRRAEGIITAPAEARRWCDLQTLTKDTVIQIFVHAAQFNWLEPYKTPNQYQSTGSGFFISEMGDIITNAHVVDQAKAISIQIPSMGKQRFDVDIVGVSPDRDLALLQLRSEDREIIIKELGKIPTLTFGDSDNVHRADEIMALGYPLGQQSLKSTTGVVSGREHIEGHSMIQISAPINPGSSGGPSLNGLGQVIGVNSAGIYGGGTQNVGYIIPSNEVLLFLRQLESLPAVSGEVKFIRKPFLGVIFNNASESLTKFLGNPTPGGLYVVETYKKSPLHKAGVLPQDMMYAIDGHKIDYFGEMNVPWSDDKISIMDYVGRLRLGDKIHLTVYRFGKKRDIALTFSQAELAPIRAMYADYEKIDYEIIGGLVVMQLAVNHLPLLIQGAPELARFAEFKNQMEPVLIVTHVFPDSAASRSRTMGIGAILQEVNGQRVKTLAEFRNAVKKSLETNYLTVKTVENVFTVLPLKRIIVDEPKLARNYYYHITPLANELIKEYAGAAAA